MSVLTKVIHQVDPQARKEGGKIRAHGDVRIIAHDDDAISASVFGGQSFGVVLARRGRSNLFLRMQGFPRVARPLQACVGHLCRGRGAGISGQLGTSRRNRAGSLRRGKLRWIEEEEEEESIEPDDDDAPARKGYPAPFTQRVEAAKPQYDWKRGLTALRQSMVVSSATPSRAWPPQKQLVYVVDAVQTMNGNGLTIELMSREPKRNGELSKPKREAIGMDDAEIVPDPADRELIAMLTGAGRAVRRDVLRLFL